MSFSYRKKSEIINDLIEEVVKDKETIKKNLVHYIDTIILERDGYKLLIKFERDK